MARFLRTRLTCFYCGRVSSQKKTPGLECFRCERCEAENYLDENGEITDPPVHTTSSARYAVSRERPVSTGSSDIFCNTCIQNQRVYAQSLAEYYPTPSLDTFEQYEHAEAEYKASLEQRYPLVCPECEPMARKRLKDASYAAKTDNLRYIMDRTRPEMMHLNMPASWKLWIVYLGGLSWALSWVGQLAWDAVSLCASNHTFEVDPYYKDVFLEMVRWCSFGEDLASDSDEKLHLLAKYALVLGFTSAWWNPRLKEKLWKKNSRMMGKQDYYTQQLIYLIVRSVAVYTLSSPQVANHEQAAHSFLLFFSFLAIIRSHYTLKLDLTPKANWRESPKSLLSQPPLSTNQDTPTVRRRRPSRETPMFPIESLARQTPQPLTPSTPFPDDDSTTPTASTAMDWVPTLPPPTPYANPYTLPLPFKPATTITPTSSIFSNLSPDRPIPTGTWLDRPPMSDPTFFPANLDKETGLETLFDSAFNISLPPTEVREKALQLSSRRHAEMATASLRRGFSWRLFTLVLLGLAYTYLLWGPTAHSYLASLTTFALPPVMEVRSRAQIALAISSFVALCALVSAGTSRARLIPSFLAAIEVMIVALFAGVVFDHVTPSGYVAGDQEAGVSVAGQITLGIVAVVEGLGVGRGVVRLVAMRGNMAD